MRGPVGAGHWASFERRPDAACSAGERALNEFAALVRPAPGGLALGRLAPRVLRRRLTQLCLTMLCCLSALGCGALVDHQSNERSDLGSTPAASLTAVTPTANPAVAPPPTASTEANALSATNGTVPYTAPSETASEILVDDAPTVPTPDEPSPIKTLTVPASDFAGDAGDCRMWLDSPTSELRVVDLEVSHGEQTWPASSSCGDDVSWSLSSDLDGTWLVLCPALCDLVRASPDTELYISVKYYTAPPLIAR